MNRIVGAVLLLIVLSAQGGTDPFKILQTGVNDEKQIQQAIEKLKTQLESEDNKEVTKPIKAKSAFALGIFAKKIHDNELALEAFQKALDFNTRIPDFASFELGLIHKENGDYETAKKHFDLVRNYKTRGSSRPSSVRRVEAHLELAGIAKAEKKWGTAFEILSSVESAHRSDPKYPQILYDIFEMAEQRGLIAEGCRRAVKLFTQFPAYTLIYKWDINGPIMHLKEKEYRCPVSVAQKEKRLTGLRQAGEFDAVRSEIQIWVDKLKTESKSHERGRVELQWGRLALVEGKTQEAITHFKAAQEILEHNLDLQTLLAQAYLQGDKFPEAIDAYKAAYDMAPYSLQGRNALFQSAFLSYESQNYDGSMKRFEKLIAEIKPGRKFASRKRRRPAGVTVEKLLWDAKWHLAWIKYLKKDFNGALQEFSQLSKEKYFANPYDLSRLTYWRAMAELRNGNTEAARMLLTQLATDKHLGYYTGAAIARLAKLPPTASFKMSPTASPTAQFFFEDQGEASRRPSNIEESLGGQTEEAPEENEQEPEQAAEAESFPVTSFKDPALMVRFERAQDLSEVGYTQWARYELKEIEKRTSNRQYMQMLINEYLKVGEYHRAAYIADVFFERTREQSGPHGAYAFWAAAFPQAYKPIVIANANRFTVDPYFSWSIIRAESGFNENSKSSVGAIGLMQMIPKTARKVAEQMKYPSIDSSMLYLPEINNQFGTWYLKRLLRLMNGNLALASASYNAGPHRTQGWLKDFGGLELDEFIEHITFLQTRNYVKKVLRNYFVYNVLYNKKNLNPLDFLTSITPRFDGPRPAIENWDQ